MDMLMRCHYIRWIHVHIKLIVCVLFTAFYFTFLFRESLNAYEQNNKHRAVNAGRDRRSTELKLVPIATNKPHRPPSEIIQQRNVTQPTESIVPLSTLNPIYEYSEEIHSATEKDIKGRLAHLSRVCKQHNLQSYYPPNSEEFFISPGHNLIWCNVFKAASSTWLYYFNILGGYNVKYLQRTETQPLKLARKLFPRPSLHELMESLSSAISFLFVRDPFERILSAYRNKLEGARNSFYKTLGQKIVQHARRHRYRNKVGRPKSLHRFSGGPTFEEFLYYLIEQHAKGKRFDEHWTPIYSFCTPCSVNFTIIGKVETFQRDFEFIIRQAGLEFLLQGELPQNKLKKIGNIACGIKTEALLKRYFSSIDGEILDQLLNIYRLDFELFDYDYMKYYELIKSSPFVGNTTSG